MTNETERAHGQVIGYDDEDDENAFVPRKRKRKAINRKIDEFTDKVWWNRHQVWLEKLERGEETLTDAKIKIEAVKAAKRIEDKYGVENLGWDDFHWGMINGYLSALRWVMGDEWDNLDT